jgi:predicted ABC-type ATPase
LKRRKRLNVCVRFALPNGGHSVPPDKIRTRHAKSLANIPRLLALCDIFTLVDNTDKPTVIFEKNGADTPIRHNRYWTAEAIEALLES